MMNEITLAPAPAPLVERLLSLTTDSALSENYACICARHEHGVRSVQIDQPTFGVVLRGASACMPRARTRCRYRRATCS